MNKDDIEKIEKKVNEVSSEMESLNIIKKELFILIEQNESIKELLGKLDKKGL